MAIRPDISVYSPDNTLQLVVEVKSKPQVSPEWAALMRRNLITLFGAPRVPFFLLALPDRLYFWKDGAAFEERLPDYQLPTQDILQDYFNERDLSARRLSEHGLELMLVAWLTDLVTAKHDIRAAKPELQWLFDSGLIDSIRQGSVRVAEAA